MEFKLSSPAFNNGTLIPSKYTCDGENISPHLVIHGVPAKTKSLALIVEDPDAPAGLWVHWVMWNIPPQTTEMREHTAPFGAREGLNTRRKYGYDGPCPPSGTHRYFFRLFALDEKLELKTDAGKEEVEGAMMGHIIATTELMGTYTRSNEGPM